MKLTEILLVLAGIAFLTYAVLGEQFIEPKRPVAELTASTAIYKHTSRLDSVPRAHTDSLMVRYKIPDSTIWYEAWKETSILLTTTRDSTAFIIRAGRAVNRNYGKVTEIDSIFKKTAGDTLLNLGIEWPPLEHFYVKAVWVGDSTATPKYVTGVVVRDRH